MRRIPFLALAALALVLAPRLGPAQAPPPAPAASIISELHFTGSRHYNEAQIAALSGLKPGDPVSREILQDVANQIAQLGIFSRVSFRYSSRGHETSVDFTLEDAPAYPVSFDNFPWFTDEELSAAVREAVPFFDGVAPGEGVVLDAISSALTAVLPQRGVSGAIEHTLLASPMGDGMILQFRVVGPALTIGSLEYTDTIARDSQRLLDRASDLIGKPFSRFAIELFLAEQVRPVYLAAGHLRVHFAPPQPRFVGDPNQPLPDRVHVIVPIEPGPAYRLAGVAWNGAFVLPQTTLATLLELRPGDLADGMRLAAAWQRVEREYGRRGYLDAKINPEPSFDDDAGTVSYSVAVDEGTQYRMGRLVITGLSLDGERLFRSHWRLPAGQIFDRTYFDDMLQRAASPTAEIFGGLPVHYSEVGHWLRTDPQSQTVDVLLDFK